MNQSVPLLDIRGAASYMGVTERFVRRLIEERRIPYYKVGKFVRFSEEDLDDFLTSVRILPKKEVHEEQQRRAEVV